MRALKKVVGVMTFAALSFSGSAVWADSFRAKAELRGFNVVPSKLSLAEGELTITFREPTTTGATIALVRRRQNPWDPRFAPNPSNDVALPETNIRLYFGQRFANGLPILTLCDNAFAELGVPSCTDLKKKDRDFPLDRIQFRLEQLTFFGSDGINDGACVGHLTNDKAGFERIRDLIKGRLIYVVVNSVFTAATDPNPNPNSGHERLCPPDITYTPPAPEDIIDGDLRGTLRLVK